MPAQGQGSRAGPQLPAPKAGRKDQRRECGHTHLQVKGGYAEVEKKVEGFPADFACNEKHHVPKVALTRQAQREPTKPQPAPRNSSVSSLETSLRYQRFEVKSR